MKIGVNPYITTPKYQKRQTAVSFQASVPKKIQSEKIFELEEALKPIWFDKEKYLAKLKEFAHIDINSRNFAGDTLITDSAKKDGRFLNSLVWMEKRGEIEGINWNATNRNGDNIIMIALKGSHMGFNFISLMNNIMKLAEEEKIDVNYVNQKQGYSLMDCALEYAGIDMYDILQLKGIDVTKTCKNKPIVKQAIDKGIFGNQFKTLVCHPSMEISKYNPQELLRYIDSAPQSRKPLNYYRNYPTERKYLEEYTKKEYKEAIQTALQMQNARKTQKYYQKNGMLTLNQIQDHIKYAFGEDAINMPLNEIGENIGHFLAEIYVEPNDTAGIAKVKDIITQLRKCQFLFWKEDDIGRTPLMIALEAENLVVARAILEKMTDGEFKYIDRGSWNYNQISRKCSINHESAIRELINKLQPKDREEFTKLFEERLTKRWE